MRYYGANATRADRAIKLREAVFPGTFHNLARCFTEKRIFAFCLRGGC